MFVHMHINKDYHKPELLNLLSISGQLKIHLENYFLSLVDKSIGSDDISLTNELLFVTCGPKVKRIINVSTMENFSNIYFEGNFHCFN